MVVRENMEKERIVIWCSEKTKRKWNLIKTILGMENEELLVFLLFLGDKKLQEIAEDKDIENILSLIEKIKKEEV